MSALDAARDSVAKYVMRYVSGPVSAGAVIYAGAIVCRDADGYFVPASDTAGLKSAVGRAEFEVDNTDGADGDLLLTVAVGVFAYNLSAALLAARVDNLGTAVFIVDDNTVGLDADAVNNIGGVTLDEISDDEALYYVRVGF
jgi:hypothetical protein